jgi:lipopolysaccharide transport system ATP-binding protein
MADAIIQVSSLSKRYRIQAHESQSDKRLHWSKILLSPFSYLATTLRSPTPEETVWALRNVSFEVRRGEIVGIIGRNGAGKSTLLRILSRITAPTEGRAIVHGRVGSLLEVGVGFHPELTGRENIYLNGAILGMKKGEIDRKLDEIVSFAEIEKFLDTPVKRYSSGMYVRLAFSVAAHLETEILLVDEVLAVGDIAFQKKCLGKMQDVVGGGRTVLFVSHNMAAVSGLCGRAILLDQGQIVDEGPAARIISRYLDSVETLQRCRLADRADRMGDGRLRVTDIVIENGAGKPVGRVSTGENVAIRISYTSNNDSPLRNVQFSLHFFTSMNQPLFNLWNEMVGDHFQSLPPKGSVRCWVPRLPLMPGRYLFNIFCRVNMEIADWVQGAGILEVAEGDFFGTGQTVGIGEDILVIPNRWELVDGTDS